MVRNLPEIIVIFLCVIMTSCTLFDDSSDSDITTLPYVDDSPYIVSVHPEWGSIALYSDWDVPVDTVCVFVDGQNIENEAANSGNLVRFGGFYDFQPNSVYHIDVTVDNQYHGVIDLKMVCIPELAIPDSLEEGVDLNLTWDLDHDAKTQVFCFLYSANADSLENPEAKMVYVHSSQREYTLSADTFHHTGDSYLTIDLEEYNWEIVGDFRFMSHSYDMFMNHSYNMKDIGPEARMKRTQMIIDTIWKTRTDNL